MANESTFDQIGNMISTMFSEDGFKTDNTVVFDLRPVYILVVVIFVLAIIFVVLKSVVNEKK